ncbi:Diacylglycerol kinase [Rubrobacter radiotolerans]|uniref:Diacylglycerol kinase n=1 Tax=Rubrobacter radiotolerans TaxID=42256 RepID=A0A023X382_RUBRA|nr:diacylglycerol kinase family protein [Rubrobacter radiotolerans]AHY46798.1 Diacylglycerol kinase [Rubrobacter radiotolerans]MDX5894205.1 diacylglycerol kinase family protein [Rubrobacter radiotolerans]SMC05468.1 diacylglycerol kinase (ATP) [Rubrobacter radiotolerans DSM 5868]
MRSRERSGGPSGKPPRRRRAPVGGFDHATRGVLATVRTQRNMKFHVLAAVAVVAAGLLFRVSALEFAALVLAMTLVLAAEVLNTAVEALVDLVSPEPHPLAKLAKDCAAGAVLVCAVGAAVVGLLVLGDDVLALARSVAGRP